tara:strand:- start:186 stop:416 length:231 start_codon:yes stop_codon:yes gene_type:complete
LKKPIASIQEARLSQSEAVKSIVGSLIKRWHRTKIGPTRKRLSNCGCPICWIITGLKVVATAMMLSHVALVVEAIR